MAKITATSADTLGVLKGTSFKKISWIERFLGPENFRILTGLLKTPASIIGFMLIGLFIIVALAAPLIVPPVTPNDPYKIPRDGFSPNPKPPGVEWSRNPPPLPFWYQPIMKSDKWIHILGVASGGYDILYGIVWGTRTAFKTGFIVVIATFLVGVTIGSISAYYGGRVDNIIMRIVDIFLTLPFLLAALILAAVITPRFGKSLYPAIIALTVFGWMIYARVIRADILSIKERDFIMAARVIGAKDGRILFRHILPNVIFPTLVLASLGIGDVVLGFAALSFLGIGTELGYADWGQIISFARNYITSLNTYWYIIVYPGLTLVLFVMSWNLVGDAMRDVLDPRMRGKS